MGFTIKLGVCLHKSKKKCVIEKVKPKIVFFPSFTPLISLYSSIFSLLYKLQFSNLFVIIDYFSLLPELLDFIILALYYLGRTQQPQQSE